MRARSAWDPVGFAGVLAALLPLAAGWVALREPGRAGASGRDESVELVEVVDGDGLRVRRGGRVEALRLACVDCEEALHASDSAARDKPQSVLGERARLRLAARLEPLRDAGPALELTYHPLEPARDGFGRLLAHACGPDGADLSVELVRAGHSPYFTKYGACPLFDRELRAAESEARAARRGIWAADANRPAAPDAPWARRDYARLSAWWELRAAAVAEYRALRARDRLAVARADDPGELARAAASPTRLFVEVVAARARDDGALELACAGGHLTIEVPADARAAFAALELEHRSWSGRANHLWLSARPTPSSGAWRARAERDGDLLEVITSGPVGSESDGTK